jgi:hypothetical protein
MIAKAQRPARDDQGKLIGTIVLLSCGHETFIHISTGWRIKLGEHIPCARCGETPILRITVD